MLHQYYNRIDKALNKACPKQKEIIINRNNLCHKRTKKIQLRIDKFARFEQYKNRQNKIKHTKQAQEALWTETKESQKESNISIEKCSGNE